MENIFIPKFITNNKKYVFLDRITNINEPDDYIVSNELMHKILNHYKHINNIFKHYHKFDIHLFTKAFSYYMYLETVNFKTRNINFDNIDNIKIHSITYYIMKYLKKSWSIDDSNIKKIHYPIKYNDKTLKTKNYIYKYYQNKLKKAVYKGNNRLRNYYDNEILGPLIFYDRVDKEDYFN